MTPRRRVALMFGGPSVEHEVSVTSARGVARAIVDAGFDLVPIGVTGEGRWLTPSISLRALDSGESRVEAVLQADDETSVIVCPGSGRLLEMLADGTSRTVPIDVVFPVLHGWGGEDGRLQGALEIAGVPYVGCGVTASALAMDKILTRRVLDANGVPGVRWIELEAAAVAKAPQADRIGSELGFPVFVKPANGGSSVGISRVDRGSELDAALELAFDCDRRVIVEEGIDAREVECALLGNESPEASVLGEIVPKAEFYDYSAKYLDGTAELIIPAEIGASVSEEIRRYALTAFRALDLAGYARIDFLVERSSGRILLNEINTLPGFTPISMFPKLWEASGLPYRQLIERLVALALDRWSIDSARRSRLGDD
jgi:D-alanine-D-alanine ligase